MLTALLYFNSFENIGNVKNHCALRPNVNFLNYFNLQVYIVKYYKLKQYTINRGTGSLLCCQSLGEIKQISCHSRVVAKFETKKKTQLL